MNNDALGFAPYSMFPPATGLRSDYSHVGGQDSANGPAMSRMSGFRQSNAQISLAYSPATTMDTSLECVKMFSVYKDATHEDLIFANRATGTNVTTLYAQDTTGSAKVSIGAIEAAVTAGAQPQAYYSHLGWVYFRNRILIATRLDGLWWYDGATRTTRLAGVVAPVAALTANTGAAGVLTGVYIYVYTNVNDQGHESTISATATVTLAAQKGALTNIAVGPTGTVSRRVYRTTAGGASYLFLTTIADNTTTTYTDNTADSGLGTSAPLDHDVPPTGIAHIAAARERVALLSTDGLTVYFCQLDSTTAQPNWESYPTALSLQIPFSGGVDVGKSLIFYNDDLYVLGAVDSYRIIGDIGTGIKVEKVLPGIGIYDTHAFCVVPGKGIVFISKAKQLLLYNGESLVDIGSKVQDRFDLLSRNVQNGVTVCRIEYDQLNDSLIFASDIDTGTWDDYRSIAGLVYSFKTQEFTGPMLWEYLLGHFSTLTYNYYGFKLADSKIYSWFAGYGSAGTQGPGPYAGYVSIANTNLYFQYFQWSPLPGDDIDYGWIELRVNAKPIVSTVVPMLKVEYALDGGSTYFSKFVDFARNVNILELATSYGSTCIRTLRVPIHKTARTITLRVSAVNNNASIGNGIEIFAVNIFARPLRPSLDVVGGH